MKTALILGAKSDMAIAIARQLAMRRIDLLLAARKVDMLESFKLELEKKHSIHVMLLEFDALNFSSHAGFVKALPKEIDAVFCVFGYLGDQQKAALDEHERQLIRDINYTGAVSVLNEIADRFKQKRHGLIVGISSVAGDRLRASNYFYGESKAALTAYLEKLRAGLVGDNVSVLTVKPGFVKTKMTGHLKLPPLVTSSAEEAGKVIVEAALAGKKEIYVSGIWRYIMWSIKMIPESIFKRMNL